MSANKSFQTMTVKEPFVSDYATREAFKTLRTNLMFCGADKKVIAVTSCQPGEGKTTTVIGLARSLAEVGKRVLVIDADMRRSTMYARYGEPGKRAGLSQLLSGQVELVEAVVATQYPGLHIMFSGYYPPNPVELLEGERFASLLSSARAEYDYVLVDCPPTGSVIDAVVVSKRCDGILMVLASGKDSIRMARASKQQLERAGCAVIGVALNMADRRQDKYFRNARYGYGYGYGYGYAYGHDKKQKSFLDIFKK